MSVAILMGSKSDLELVRPAIKMLKDFGIEYDVRVLSAHRTPHQTVQFVEAAKPAGIKVFICCAGAAAHLAGVVAGHTTLPVIGVPLARTPLGGLDALYATVQMPPGMPVATVGVDRAANGALLAIQMLALNDPALDAKLVAYRKSLTDKVMAADDSLEAELNES
jgi:5-(carboxyamino)imidazole ribonucleotide mutase